MKRLLISICACALVALNLLIGSAAQAQPLAAIVPSPWLIADAMEMPADFMKHLQDEFLPQIENILYPEQREQFKQAIADGTSFRKAFKSLTLSPEQKAELGTLLKSLPKKDIFASLTPDQKKQLFMKKREMFMPTAEEISERISDKLKMVKPELEKIGDKLTEAMQ